jgi:type IV secretion system protein VirD4
MTQQQIILILVCAGVFGLMALVIYISSNYNLNRIKNKTVGDGQHGTARWATKSEIRRTYRRVEYSPEEWRKGGCGARVTLLSRLWARLRHKPPKERPAPPLPQGIIMGSDRRFGKTTALVDTGDVHVLMIAAAGAGKTACFLYPNIEYACACGVSFLSTDSKGDVYRNCAPIAKEKYGYNVAVIDLRNPTRSDGFNMLQLVNRYMDIYKAIGGVANKAKAEKYAKIAAKTIIFADGGDAAQYGPNAYFYDAAEGLLTSVVLLIAEFAAPKERHIISAFKLVQDLLAPSEVQGQSRFQQLINLLPGEHKARWFAGAALNASEGGMASVLSTVLSRLNAFLDSELEQVLCFDTAIDAESFCREKSAVFLVLPEEEPTKHFLVGLIMQQLYREILSVADENGGKLDNRVVFYADELGLIPFQSLELVFSASRSRRLTIVGIIQSMSQLQKNYGKEGAEIIVDNVQDTIFGGFAPGSETAESLSKALGSRTVLSGSVNKGIKQGSENLQMMQRPLLTPDELKALPKQTFVVMKTGTYPTRTRLRLFFDWGITFDKAYQPTEQAERRVSYAGRESIEAAIWQAYPGQAPAQAPAPTVPAQGQTQQPAAKKWTDKKKKQQQSTKP